MHNNLLSTGAAAHHQKTWDTSMEYQLQQTLSWIMPRMTWPVLASAKESSALLHALPISSLGLTIRVVVGMCIVGLMWITMEFMVSMVSAASVVRVATITICPSMTSSAGHLHQHTYHPG